VLFRRSERDDAAEAAAHDGGAFATGPGAVLRIDEGLQLGGQPLQIARAFAAAPLRLVVAAHFLNIHIGGVVGHALG